MDSPTFYASDIEWYLGGDFEKIQDRNLPTTINAEPFSGMARYREDGRLEQIGLYDTDGRIIYHLDRLDQDTSGWHWHNFTEDLGNPDVGHRPREENHPLIGDGTFNALETLMRELGFEDIDWRRF